MKSDERYPIFPSYPETDGDGLPERDFPSIIPEIGKVLPDGLQIASAFSAKDDYDRLEQPEEEY